ncbi:hypothetical protein A3758_08410 [Oleiphilus sp. HI0118]|nr:hypothetical protein A3758_08410 [Oleiphilus sp. HI0118]
MNLAQRIKREKGFILAFALLMLITLSASAVEDEEDVDPYEGFNRAMFSFNEQLDIYLAKPVAQFYDFVMPSFLNQGVTNFFNNLDDVETFANSLLQGKFHNSVVTLNRVIWNTTVGLAGFIDVATHFGLRNDEEDFGQTLAVWGYENSAYVVWPFFGPSTIRDSFGRAADTYTEPLNYVESFSTVERLAIQGLKYTDLRADLLSVEGLITGNDPYIFIRNAYLQNREFLIRDGAVVDEFAADDLYLEDF